ncbi:---NA--- : Endoglucanase OS=Azorhizobium caulinodans (strain ATCC 43989 / DSM 5975 / ORS 571) GN=AZC_1301 PE=3 SV=1: Calx-beta [Gemmataceae bacterium]|nr:---NA--- : Endoglucanase OS=Azorhizobium caulinodans (strain ATCC 43989 / DSM 5975 / ORS 571) GN=AZC_1301 PE=3 SV=1: Calx-beta [Gemmataceae bacterium]VTT98079.1 ---NA--- : Endoglucanase OS=Azorhizobium caulinodans (strain ATCC 43989 / DSM 5975 / ORS 571) GN=AZC_1301 PE=3 SV=1: Calx-beta [Gemmataceae bacterium]
MGSALTVAPPDRRTRLGVEGMEDRTVPAAIPLTGPNGGAWVKVDTLTVATRTNQTAATGVQSNVVLDAGTTYLAVASGTARIANDATGFTDAEYIRYNKSTGPQDGSSPGYAWNNHGVRLAGLDGGDTTGNFWGGYQTDHQYVREVTGQGTTATGYFSDIPGYYGDNSGSLTVDIYAELPVVSIQTDVDVAGDDGEAVIVVSLSHPSAVPLTVEYATADLTALAASDYTAAAGTVTFLPGETSKEIRIAVSATDEDETAPEAFTVALRSPRGAVLGSNATSTVSIDRIGFEFSTAAFAVTQKLVDALILEDSEEASSSSFGAPPAGDSSLLAAADPQPLTQAELNELAGLVKNPAKNPTRLADLQRRMLSDGVQFEGADVLKNLGTILDAGKTALRGDPRKEFLKQYRKLLDVGIAGLQKIDEARYTQYKAARDAGAPHDEAWTWQNGGDTAQRRYGLEQLIKRSTDK